MSTALTHAWKAHQLYRIPDDSSDAELGRIHADIVLYDDTVAGTVATVLSGGKPSRVSPPHDLLERKLESIIALGDSRQARASEYLQYVRHLSHLLVLAEKGG